MNRAYTPESGYTSRPVCFPEKEGRKQNRDVIETILCFFDLVIAFFSETAVRTTLRTVSAVACFFAFLFVIGAVESATMSFGGGILLSLLLLSIAFFSVYRPKKNNT